jgi:hypothetical protein
MERTPDEIKKGLADNIPVHYHLGDLEPRLTPLMMVDLEDLHADALTLIQKLEAERDAAVADLEHVKDCDSCKYDDACFTGKKDCFGCHEKRCPCLTCQYEWRGVQKEDDDA